MAGVLLYRGDRVGAVFSSGVHPSLGLDPLSSFFALTVAAVAVPALIFASSYLAGTPRAGLQAALAGLFIAAMLLVLAARDPSTFLAGWELMTILPAASILVAHSDRPVRHAVLVYLAVTHLGGAGVWFCLLLLSSLGAVDSPTGLATAGVGLSTAVSLSALVGFGTKAGLMPMHSWLPRAHPVAPAHMSALMSGVMIKVALYGLIRVLFYWAPGQPIWVGVLVIALGALSALGGVLYALFEHELKRLLAFHSIENVGIITMGLGAALLFGASGQRQWAAIAFAVALLHTLNHAIFKGLLFLGAGAIERATHAHHIDRSGGILRLMPATGVAFGIGSMAIAGLPPLNGFASEWLTFQSLLHVGRDRIQAGWAGPLAAVALAVTAAMAVLCFVKVIGLVLLGSPRHSSMGTARDVPAPMRWSQLSLAAGCLLLGLFPGLLLHPLLAIRGQAPLEWNPNLALPATGGLPTVAIGVYLVGVAALLVALRGRYQAEPAPAWTCGQLIEPSLNWTSSAFTKALRLSLEQVLRPTREIVVHRSRGVIRSVEYSGHLPHLFDTVLYGPVTRGALAGANRARRLQSGDLSGYALYLAGLVAILLALVRTGLIS